MLLLFLCCYFGYLFVCVYLFVFLFVCFCFFVRILFCFVCLFVVFVLGLCI